jgi:hypothetical protein
MYVCKKCNQAVNETAKFCPKCGSPQDAAMYGIRDFTTKRRPLSVFRKIMLCLVGLCLVFLPTRSVLLTMFGATTQAVVYNAEQQELRNSTDRHDPTRWELSYRYTVSGKTYESKDTMYFEYGYTVEIDVDGKGIPKTAVVRYLPAVPHWSRIESVSGGRHVSHLMENPFGWLGPILLVMLLAGMIIRNRHTRKIMNSERKQYGQK